MSACSFSSIRKVVSGMEVESDCRSVVGEVEGTCEKVVGSIDEVDGVSSNVEEEMESSVEGCWEN